MWLISTNSIVSGGPSIACPMHAAPGPMNGMGSLWSVLPLRKGSVTDLPMPASESTTHSWIFTAGSFRVLRQL